MKDEPGSPLYANALCHAWMNHGRAAMHQQKLEIAADIACSSPYITERWRQHMTH